MDMRSQLFPPSDVQDDLLPKEVYWSREFAELEEERLWPFVWQLACRLEEIPNAGDYYTYDIVDDSIIVLRSDANTVKAFHNTCSHRGLPLVSGTGQASSFHCRFHGWKYDLNGACTDVIDRDDWKGRLTDEDTRLKEVKVALWGGAVFINMDPDCEPFEKFIQPIDQYCDKFEFEKLRYRWHKTVTMPVNWKLVLEAFNEFYHVQQAHKQLLSFTDDYSASSGYGRHSKVWFTSGGSVPFNRSPRLPPKEVPDYREYLLDFVENYNRDLKAMVTERSYKATQRLRTEVPATATPDEVLAKWFQFQVEAAKEDGSGWPAELTPDYIRESGLDWHLFPNTVFLHATIDGVLWYRARPNGHDPDSCIFEIAALERFGPGQVPELKREVYKDWRDTEWPLIYKQDFVNLSVLQRGMKSRGLKGLRINPQQERALSNFHRALRRFLNDPKDSPDPVKEA
jgi:phenylpropionate dioxygenase-like ring-hydroxylating dioxygenase large terminal subunit